MIKDQIRAAILGMAVLALVASTVAQAQSRSSLSPPSLTLPVGKNAQLTPLWDGKPLAPQWTTNANWSSSAPEVVLVNGGLVTGLKAGTATINWNYSGNKGSSTVTVVAGSPASSTPPAASTAPAAPKAFSITPDKPSIEAGATVQLAPLYGGDRLAPHSITAANWGSSDAKIATVC